MAERTLILRVIADDRSLQTAMARDARAVDTFGKQSTTSLQKFDSAFTRTQKIAAGGFLGGAAIALVGPQISAAIGAASDLQEQQSKVTQIFDESSEAIKAWSETTSEALGLSQRAALEAAGNFGQLFQTAGLSASRAAEMSRQLVGLASDLASFNNIDPGEALEKLRSGLAGEAEPLRRVGVLLSEARVKEEAYAAGIARRGAELTEAEKVQARFNLILKDTASAQGDYARTSESLANQQRSLAAKTEDLQASLGRLASPTLTSLITGLSTATDLALRFADALGGLDRDSNRITFGDLFSSFADIPEVFRKSLIPPWKWDDVAKAQSKAASAAFQKDFQFTLPGVTPVGSGDNSGKGLAAQFRKGIDGAFAAAQNAAREAIDDGQRRIDAEAARVRQEDFFGNLIESLELGLDRAGLTEGLGDDLKALRDLKAGLERQVRAGVDVAAAQRKLVGVVAQITDAQEQLAQQARDAAQARQFRALGLTGSGDDIVPGVDNLRKRINGALARINSGDLDVPSKLVDRLKAARQLIRKEGKALTEDTRRVINDFLKAADGDRTTDRQGPLTKSSSIGAQLNALLGGLGLSRDQERQLRARMSGFNSVGRSLAGNQANLGGGTGQQAIVVDNHITVSIDGNELTTTVTRNQQKTARRNPRQKRGPNRRGGL